MDCSCASASSSRSSRGLMVTTRKRGPSCALMSHFYPRQHRLWVVIIRSARGSCDRHISQSNHSLLQAQDGLDQELTARPGLRCPDRAQPWRSRWRLRSAPAGTFRPVDRDAERDDAGLLSDPDPWGRPSSPRRGPRKRRGASLRRRISRRTSRSCQQAGRAASAGVQPRSSWQILSNPYTAIPIPYAGTSAKWAASLRRSSSSAVDVLQQLLVREGPERTIHQ
jgi:hypothetical protein